MDKKENIQIKKKHIVIAIVLLIVVVSVAFFVFNSGKKVDRNIISSKGKNLRVAELSLPGMFCAGCASSSQSTLENMPGVMKADVDINTKEGVVIYDSKVISKEQLVQNGLIQSYDGTILSDKKYSP